MGKRIKNLKGVHPDLFKQYNAWSKYLKGMSNTNFRHLQSSIFGPDLKGIKEIRDAFNPTTDVSRELQKTFKPILEAVRKFQIEFAPIAIWLKEEGELEQYCDRTGWVPHEVLKGIFDYSNEGKEEQIDSVISEWPTIQLELSTSFPCVGVEAKRRHIFNELLAAHGAGSYSVVRRSAIIEIEGLAADFCARNLKRNTSFERKKIVENAEKHYSKLTPRQIGGMLPYVTMKKYSEEIFASTDRHKHTPANKVNFEINRNAQAHGDGTVGTFFTSLNALLLLHHYAKYFSLMDSLILIGE